jgi:D-alanyl-D-alanine carboxypeptidase/D-alanyl-D-alanine-endopeptidase (penicillin-binding protein 4)
MSAKTFADMYENAYYHYGQRWMNTLSIAGKDGTIKKRFRNAPAKNRAWMKTGTLKNVKNIGGYVKNRKGVLYTVVIIVNTKQARWRASSLQNNIINWLANTTMRSSRKKKYTEQSNSFLKSSNHFIQVGSYSKEPNKEYLSRIKKLKLPYRVVYEGQYKIFVGPYKDKNSANKALSIVRTNLNAGAFLVYKNK